MTSSKKPSIPRIKWKRALLPIAFLSLLLFQFNNCSASKMSYNEDPSTIDDSSLAKGSACDMTDKDLFTQGYHVFFKTECKACHINGPGKGTFANPDVNLAFPSFQAMGYSTLSTMALSKSHSFATGTPKAQATIPGLKEQWQLFQTEKSKCGQAGGGTTTGTTPGSEDSETEAPEFSPLFVSLKKSIPKVIGTDTAVPGVKTFNRVNVEYNLDSDLSALTEKAVPSTGGAKLRLTLTGYSNASGVTGYLIQMPTLITGTKSLQLKGLHFSINGFNVSYNSTFQRLDVKQYLGLTTMISGGSMLILGPLLDNDEISISIGDLDVIELAPPAPPPKLQFAVESMTRTLSPSDLVYDKVYEVTVTVDGDTSESLTVDIKPEGTAKSLMGPDGRNLYDWDFQFKKADPKDPPTNIKTLTFAPGEKSKTVQLLFSDDQRYDVDPDTGALITKTLVLRLTEPFGAVLGTNVTSTITIPEFTPAPTDPRVMTFSRLMDPDGGILKVYCVRCHNSIDRNGDYDLTDYHAVVLKKIIVPGATDPLQHKMYRRMKNDAPGSTPGTAMPVDGYLSSTLTNKVAEWLAAGAKNN